MYDISGVLDIYSPVNYGYAAIYLSWNKFKPGVNSARLAAGQTWPFFSYTDPSPEKHLTLKNENNLINFTGTCTFEFRRVLDLKCP